MAPTRRPDGAAAGFTRSRLARSSWETRTGNAPDTNEFVRASGDKILAIGTENDGLGRSFRCFQFEQLLTHEKVPNANGPVAAAGDQSAAVGAERDRVDEIAVAAQGCFVLGLHLIGSEVPETDLAFPIAGGEVLAQGMKGDAGDIGSSVTGNNHALKAALGKVPEEDPLISVADRGKLATVMRIKRQANDGTVVLMLVVLEDADALEVFGVRGVPDGDDTVLAAADKNGVLGMEGKGGDGGAGLEYMLGSLIA